MEIGIGPADGPTRTERRWEAPTDDRIEIYDGDELVSALEIVSASEDVLRVRRHD